MSLHVFLFCFHVRFSFYFGVSKLLYVLLVVAVVAFCCFEYAIDISTCLVFNIHENLLLACIFRTFAILNLNFEIFFGWMHDFPSNALPPTDQHMHFKCWVRYSLYTQNGAWECVRVCVYRPGLILKVSRSLSSVIAISKLIMFNVQLSSKSFIKLRESAINFSVFPTCQYFQKELFLKSFRRARKTCQLVAMLKWTCGFSG